MSGLVEAFPAQRAAAIVELGAITENCAALKARLAAATRLCAVVKANGYGHGAEPSARAALAGGAELLAVAAATEAFELRESFPETPILLLGALGDAELDVALAARAEISVWEPQFLSEVALRAARLGVRPRIHVKYDTGMGRLGARDPAVVEALLAQAGADDAVESAGLWTHFATADEDDQTYLDAQLERFTVLAAAARERLPNLLIHAANSAATIRRPESHFDMVRCGVAIYGLDPFGADPTASGLRPAMSLVSSIAAIRRCERGDSVGYGRRWHAESPTVVATVPIGYGDGYRRALTNNAEVLIAGRRYPVIGTVSMDNIAVDLGSQTTLSPGEPVILIGRDGDQRISAEELAGRLGTINYEVTCGLTTRVPRIHLGPAAPPR